jgi:hypothetical protein
MIRWAEPPQREGSLRYAGVGSACPAEPGSRTRHAARPIGVKAPDGLFVALIARPMVLSRDFLHSQRLARGRADASERWLSAGTWGARGAPGKPLE